VATGIEIKQIYDAMKEICVETSEFIKVVNDLFAEQGFKPPKNTVSVMWDTSTSYLNPHKWLPYFQQRVYRKYKTSIKSKAVGINVMFDNGNNKIPYISCAFICAKERQIVNTSDEFYWAGWGYSSVSYNNPFYVTNFQIEQDYPGKYKTIINYFLPFDCIVNKHSVEHLVVQPLIAMYNKDVDKARTMVAKSAIELKDIMTTT